MNAQISTTLTRTPAAMEAIVLRFSPQSMHSEHLKPSRNPDIFSGHFKKHTNKNQIKYLCLLPSNLTMFLENI